MEIEHRYEERGDTFSLSSWVDNDDPTKTYGKSVVSKCWHMTPLAERPMWLVNIVNTAKVGGYAKPIPNPPPDVIIWFFTDSEGGLIRFTEFDNDPF